MTPRTLLASLALAVAGQAAAWVTAAAALPLG